MATRPKSPTKAPTPRPPQGCLEGPRSGRATARFRGAAVKEQTIEAGTGIVGWVDERTGASGFLRGFLFRKVPKGTNWFYTLGSATMFAFVSQAVTGVFLAMYYTRRRPGLRQRAAHNQRRLPRRAGARHAPLGRDGHGRA